MMRAYESASAHAREAARRKIHARQVARVRASLLVRPTVTPSTLTTYDASRARRIAR